ncbi:phosphogluconate dehydratase [Fluoribacter dumoffii]|uniref:Phosphogluconate dehydratase n=1 Tax=Fluoribacter dumoffii TaxID=463 RepID=A0A377GCT2_9GAMM|nr:phosphogluconate dehydratase [Fluoribacter dumoffii]KTC90775.1 6-phosphogluconate dehydratase [Fluoribacter dumoffii NY 23]MCW8386618.1 phosphogluconate dehydratase [Fluoribacter dumoffii]MCW8419672.1 phosphogluconate dehydratase [Fluoribacter dumoffii]MCW8455625.1 phosphogluconate dehydratase [Fluoribacter dumoffii]MCW8460296.1 phosphogluconate dehydratase [Fluoribacter dumoffii]
MHPVVAEVTDRIRERSTHSRDLYLENIEKSRIKGPQRGVLHCGNLAHGFAACAKQDKLNLSGMTKANIAIISAYNDMLSAHQPYLHYPSLIKEAISAAGGIAQFAAGVPAMCDGITQGQPGMELSLLSRDVIAMSTAIGLSHNMFDGGLLLGICDKIVPGLLMAALSFGHLPFIFIPAGPMPSGISNQEKARIRQLYAEGKADRSALLKAEAASYHSPGTCTFYGTANSNQLVIETMGLQLPGSSFINPNTPLRDALTRYAAQQVLALTDLSEGYMPIGQLLDVKNLVNGIVALLASGGSTNHTMHLVAIATLAGYSINWDDFAQLSAVTPLIAKIYPNGDADINHFQQAGGMAYFINTLLEARLLHEDVDTVMGHGLQRYTQQPLLDNEQLVWVSGPSNSTNERVLTSAKAPFKTQGGLQVVSGNIGRAVIKTSGLPAGRSKIKAPAIVCSSQEEFEQMFQKGMLDKDCIVVVRFQGPKACGMPELHQLTPKLGVLMDKGYQVALVTDGRMSGASGKVPAAIHVTPEALDNEVLSRIENGDMILIDAEEGLLQLFVAEEELKLRAKAALPATGFHFGTGRELFTSLRVQFTGAEQGACSLFQGKESCYE